jgi:hypothetical protein
VLLFVCLYDVVVPVLGVQTTEGVCACMHVLVDRVGTTYSTYCIAKGGIVKMI